MNNQSINLPEDEEILWAVIKPFEAVKQFFPSHLLSALVPTEKSEGYTHINYIVDNELQETCNFVNDFNTLLNMADDTHRQIRIKLLVYCHIMESDYPFIVLWNLLRILDGQPCKWTFTRITNKGDEEICRYTEQKINELERLSSNLGLPTGTVLSNFWDNDMRNTFSHSQYILDGNRYFSTRTLSPFSRASNKQLFSSDIDYPFAHINELYSKATGFLRTFVEVYKHYIMPFKDGENHHLQDGIITWDRRGRWVWQQ